MTTSAAFGSLFAAGLLIGLSGSAVRAFGQDAAGSTPATVVLRAVVLPSISIHLEPADSSRPGEGDELVAHWNLGSGHNTDLMVARSMDPQSSFGSARPRIVPATYRSGASCLEWGREFSPTSCDSARLLAVGLATRGRQRLESLPLRISLPRLTLDSRYALPGTLDIRLQAM